jgi:hypothetical protein
MCLKRRTPIGLREKDIRLGCREADSTAHDTRTNNRTWEWCPRVQPAFAGGVAAPVRDVCVPRRRNLRDAPHPSSPCQPCLGMPHGRDAGGSAPLDARHAQGPRSRRRKRPACPAPDDRVVHGAPSPPSSHSCASRKPSETGAPLRLAHRLRGDEWENRRSRESAGGPTGLIVPNARAQPSHQRDCHPLREAARPNTNGSSLSQSRPSHPYALRMHAMPEAPAYMHQPGASAFSTLSTRRRE